jgi:hypothetical protein
MLDRQRITSYGIATTAAATVALALWLKPWRTETLVEPPATARPTPTETDHHKIDVVFAVDTTGSMGGLIDGAKRTVWSIATHIRELDKQADVHIGLVAYRDLGDAYVTKDFALTGDLDAVFAELSSYRAEGGGDIPEDVDAALYDAVHKMQWRDGANKMIFLVGDAPPASRGDVPKFDLSARDAAVAQIKLNTIRCGTDADTAQSWQQIAMLGHGEFSTIQQDGGVQQVATPYDDKLAEVSARIDATTTVYADHAGRERYMGKMAAASAAPAAAKADRATYYAAKPAAPRQPEDITGGVASGAVKVESLDEGKLPADLKGRSKEELKTELDKRAKDRAAAQQELADLARKRADYLRDHAKGGDGFDAKVKATVEHELAH